MLPGTSPDSALQQSTFNMNSASVDKLFGVGALSPLSNRELLSASDVRCLPGDVDLRMSTIYNFADAERRVWFWPLGHHQEEALTGRCLDIRWFSFWGLSCSREESQIRPVGPYDFSTLLVDPPRFPAFRKANLFKRICGILVLLCGILVLLVICQGSEHTFSSPAVRLWVR